MINVHWNNRLEALAAQMFEGMAQQRAASPSELLRRRRCVVVPNRITQHWLQHEFLFREQAQEVLTNIEFPLVHVFVNDCLFRMDTDPEAAPRDPDAHPFSREALGWRILHLLQDPTFLDNPACAPLRDFLKPRAAVGANSTNQGRCFKLASRLATLLDEYMVYRPAMLLRWEQGDTQVPDRTLAWQPILWNALTPGALRNETYLAAFQRMDRGLRRGDLVANYDRIQVFNVSMLPRVYIHFFELLSNLIPVDFHVLNPSSEAWFEMPAGHRAESALQGRLDTDDDLLGLQNGFLGLQGRGNRNFLVELLDRTEGQAEADGAFADPGNDTLLHALQSQILANTAAPHANPSPEAVAHPSLCSAQLHICHSPMREVQVLHDHLSRWFFADPELQPRQVQVLVSDMATYAPYIQAVFAAPRHDAPEAIPFALADRVAASESTVAMAFTQLLSLADSRFTAPEVLDLLHCEAVRAAFGIEEPSVEPIKEWVATAGIRWGRSRQHRSDAVGVEFEDYTTWRRGLDRLLLGYAYGRAGDQISPSGSIPLPCDCVEGRDAVTLGRFVSLTDKLEELADLCATPHTPADWADILDRSIETCFASTEETYREILLLRRAVDRLRKSSAAASCTGPMGIDVVRNFLNRHLQDVLGGDFLGGNVVVFSALRPGSSLPRKVICLLGMVDGAFPRSDNRPAYDILRIERRFGDRSLRQEDRMAFLEAILNARDRLYISFPGFSPEDNRPIPASVVVSEWLDAMAAIAGAPSPNGGKAEPACVRVHHHLQPYHPDYFLPGADQSFQNPLFSYSAEAARTARSLLARKAGTRPSCDQQAASGAAAGFAATPAKTLSFALDLEDLTRFFKNPAEAYYKNVLGTRLDVDEEAALADAETFQPGGLDRYAVHAKMVDALAAAPAGSPEIVRRQLLEQGKLPLGRRGARWFDDQWEDVSAFLEQDVPDCGGTLRELVRVQNSAAPVRQLLQLTLPGASVSLTGQCASAAQPDESRRRLDFRYVSDKAHDRLSAWLRHLFACATCGTHQSLYVRRDKAGAMAILPLPAVPAAEAKARLCAYLQLYVAGQRRPLPFQVVVSAAYAKDIRAGKTQPAALQAARGKWDPYEGERPCDDVYCQAAFGEHGPFDLPDFDATAMAVFPEIPCLTP